MNISNSNNKTEMKRSSDLYAGLLGKRYNASDYKLYRKVLGLFCLLLHFHAFVYLATIYTLSGLKFLSHCVFLSLEPQIACDLQ